MKCLDPMGIHNLSWYKFLWESGVAWLCY